MKRTNPIFTLDLSSIPDIKQPSRLTKEQKIATANRYINTNYYKILGPIGRTTKVEYTPKFYAIRDSSGRFTRV